MFPTENNLMNYLIVSFMSHETPAMVKEVSNELHQQSEAETSLSLWNSARTTLIRQKSILVKICIYIMKCLPCTYVCPQ